MESHCRRVDAITRGPVIAMATPPDHIAAAAAELEFEIIGWDETHGGVKGVDNEFVGTHAEVNAYLQGWIHHAEQNPRVMRRSMLVLRTNGPYDNQLTIEPGVMFQVTTRPQVAGFKTDRIAIPADIARYFEILDITIGNRSQNPQEQTIPGETFAMPTESMLALLDLNKGVDSFLPKIAITQPALAEFGREFDMDIGQIAMDIVVVARLLPTAPGPMSFVMVMLGTLERDRPLARLPRPKKARITAEEARELLTKWHDIINQAELGEESPE